MYTRWTYSLLIQAVLICGWQLPALAQEPKPGLVAEYFQLEQIPESAEEFPDLPLDAVATQVRVDREIKFSSTDGTFGGTKLVDHFFVRWTGILRVPKAGSYNLWVASDDGSRLFLDGERIVDNWGPHGEVRIGARVDLEARDYEIRVDYYDISATSSCHLGWDPPEGMTSGNISAENLFHPPHVLNNARARVKFQKSKDDTPRATVTDKKGYPRFGYIYLKKGKVVIEQAGDNFVALDTDEVSKIQFNNIAWGKPKQRDDTEAPRTGPLAKPWKHTVVGRLASGSSAHGDGREIELFTSARHESERFSSYAMAYMPAPKTGHFTARVTKIEDMVYGSHAGIALRDGTSMDDRNIMLTVMSTGGVTMRHWKTQGGSARSDSRGNIKPPYWVRLIRDGETIKGLTSPDGRAWRLIWEVPEKFEGGEFVYGLVAGGREGGNKGPWAAGFDNISVGSLEDAELRSNTTPRVYLTDGSVIRAKVTTSESGKLFKFGEPWNRSVPALYVARVDFFHPISNEVEERLATMRPGVLLTGGDFMEAEFENIQDESLNVVSKLFGKRTLRPGITADSLILRAAEGGRKSDLRVETWDNQVFFARGFTVENGKFVFDAPFVGKPAFGPEKLRCIVPVEE